MHSLDLQAIACLPQKSSNIDEIIKFTEEVLDAEGIECDAKISKLSEDKLKEILELVRKKRKERKKKQDSGQELAIIKR